MVFGYYINRQWFLIMTFLRNVMIKCGAVRLTMVCYSSCLLINYSGYPVTKKTWRHVFEYILSPLHAVDNTKILRGGAIASEHS